jgi:hypothetical protein
MCFKQSFGVGLTVLTCFFFLGFIRILEPGSLQTEEGPMMENASNYLIDDFSNDRGVSRHGTEWRMFTDRVMGGVSTATSGYEMIQGRRCLRLRGSVSLENRGGFIQVALPLKGKVRLFDAGGYTGVRLSVVGNGEVYHVHLRTSRTVLPWQYYWAAFDTGPGWQIIDIPFDRFKPENLGKALNPRKLKRIAIVAIKKEFQADVAVSRLEFYR